MKIQLINNLKIIFGLSLILILYSCSQDFLEEKVDNRVLINDLDQMEAAVRGLNPRADGLFTEFMTDDYVFKSVPSNLNRSIERLLLIPYFFRNTKDHLLESDYSINNFNANTSWVRYYYRIQNAFLIIDKVTEYQSKNAKEQKKKNAIIGRALAIKAYCNFMLVNLFAKDYNPTTATKDKGIPLVLKYTGEAIENYPIASVQQTYDNIEQDLLKALPLLDDNSVENKKFNFTTISVNALLCRFYLFKHDWKKAVQYADLVINKNNSVLNIKELATRYASKSSEYSKQYFNPDNKSYLLMSENTKQFISFPYSNLFPYPLRNFLISKGRLQNGTYQDFIQTSPLYNNFFPVKTLYLNESPPDGLLIGVFPLLSVDEVYYNRAEANIELGNIQKTKEDLKLLLSKDYYTTNSWTGLLDGITTKDKLISYLLDSKRMRFFGEGMRWFDIKRHSIPVTHLYKTKKFIIDETNPESYVIKFPSEEQVSKSK